MGFLMGGFGGGRSEHQRTGASIVVVSRKNGGQRRVIACLSISLLFGFSFSRAVAAAPTTTTREEGAGGGTRFRCFSPSSLSASSLSRKHSLSQNEACEVVILFTPCDARVYALNVRRPIVNMQKIVANGMLRGGCVSLSPTVRVGVGARGVRFFSLILCLSVSCCAGFVLCVCVLCVRRAVRVLCA
jgi:hypothetical protein